MQDWVRNLLLLVVLTMWSAYIGVTLIRGEEIDTVVWGVPGAAYFALNPVWRRAGDQPADSPPSTPTPPTPTQSESQT